MFGISPKLFFVVGVAIAFAGYFAQRIFKFTLTYGALFWWVTRSKFARDRRVYRVAWIPNQIKKEIPAVLKVAIFDCLLLALIVKTMSGFSLEWRGVPAFVITFAAIWVWFDFWFYWSHRAMHHPKLFWIHATHHHSKVNTPLTSNTFSVLERAIMTGGGFLPPYLIADHVPLSFHAMVFFFFVMGFFNLYGHLNVEIVPARFRHSRWFMLFGTPTFHAMHHARARGHFGLLMPWWDKMFGTFFEDYPEAFERAATGRGFTKLNERAAIGATSTSQHANARRPKTACGARVAL